MTATAIHPDPLNDTVDVSFAAPAWWRKAWEIPPRQLRKRDWAERYIVVGKGARPGPFRLATNPLLGPILDVLDHPDVREVALRKAVQTGGSLLARIDMAHVAHTDPCFAMLVLPSQSSGRIQIKKYWRPLLSGKECPVLRQFQRAKPRRGRPRHGHEDEETDRSTYENVVLNNGFDLLLGYSGSVTSLAAHACKKVVFDEVDKYNDWDGDEASPLDLGRQRTMTYSGVQKILTLSTPTIETGTISVEFENADIKLYPFVGCNECRRPIQLIFQNVIFDLPDHKVMPDANQRAAHLRRNRELAWLGCPHCHAKHFEKDAPALLRSVWLATIEQDWQLHADGREVGTKPVGDRVGVHFPQLASTIGLGLIEMAAQWIEADGNPKKIQNCKNNHHGEPFVFDQVKPAKGRLLEKCRPNPETGFVPPKAKVVPAWASRLIMTVDTQADKFYWVIRAWGARMRSRLIAYGEALTFQQLEYLLHEAVWPNEDPQLPSRRVWICAIDSGGGIDREGANATRTEQVYKWCAANPQTRLAIKGSNKPLETLTRLRRLEYQSPKSGESINVNLLWVDPLGSGDVLSAHQVSELEVFNIDTGEVSDQKVDQWELNDEVGNDYLRHLQVMTRKTVKRGTKRAIVWVEESDGARHDFFDCERYQQAVAHDATLGCAALPDERSIRLQVSKTQAVASGQGNSRVAGGFRLGVPTRNR